MKKIIESAVALCFVSALFGDVKSMGPNFREGITQTTTEVADRQEQIHQAEADGNYKKRPPILSPLVPLEEMTFEEIVDLVTRLTKEITPPVRHPSKATTTESRRKAATRIRRWRRTATRTAEEDPIAVSTGRYHTSGTVAMLPEYRPAKKRLDFSLREGRYSGNNEIFDSVIRTISRPALNAAMLSSLQSDPYIVRNNFRLDFAAHIDLQPAALVSNLQTVLRGTNEETIQLPHQTEQPSVPPTEMQQGDQSTESDS
jgi:hypothetical protein